MNLMPMMMGPSMRSFGGAQCSGNFASAFAGGGMQQMGCDPRMMQMAQQGAQLMMMMQMMQMLMSILSGGGQGMGQMGNMGNCMGGNPMPMGSIGNMGSPMMGGMPGGSFSPMGSPGGYLGNLGNNFCGGPTGGYNGNSNIPTGPVGQGQQAAVDLGRRFLGQNSSSLRGQLPNFTAAGGQTNNCADFVSSLLQSTGQLQGHHVGVSDLENALRQQGYHQVSAAQAKPGDVWISNSRGHTEMVTAPGGTMAIGSNNDRPGHQVVSEKPLRPGSGVYYSRG